MQKELGRDEKEGVPKTFGKQIFFKAFFISIATKEKEKLTTPFTPLLPSHPDFIGVRGLPQKPSHYYLTN